jgi:signal transduction histidine kinase/CheY-like chemotaxis protein
MQPTRSIELAQAAELRRRAVPQRLLAVGAMAVAFHLAYGWALVWLWAAAYAVATAVEHAAGETLARRVESGQSPRGIAYTASIMAVSLVYGAMSVPLLLLEHARDGEVYGLILLAGGLVNLLIVSRASWLAFLATVIPYGGYLLINPVLAYAAGVDTLSWVAIFGAAMLVLHTHAAWARQRRALLAEAEARAELERRRQDAEFAAAAKSAFVAMVSHELRTPLSGIMAAGEQLQKHGPDGARREAVEVVVDAGRFMHALLDDLLDLAKLEAGRMTVEKIDFDLGQLLWSLERHWTAAADRTGTPLRLTSALNLPVHVAGDPTRLRQILNNLLSNAVKFTGPEGVTWSVDGQEDGDLWWLEMRVSDSGPGIAPEKLDRLFTPYDQTDESIARTHGGTGLGLALSRELARLMGGELTVESELGAGSTFVLHVPLARAEGVLADAGADVDAAAPTRALRVLVVDDHEINRRTASLLLEVAGMETVTVETGQEALAVLDIEPIDVVITDVNMPGMNGLQLTRAIRERVGLNRSVPVLAFTGSDSPEEIAACRAAGMRGHISKPVDAASLYRAIEEACSGRAPATDRVEVA